MRASLTIAAIGTCGWLLLGCTGGDDFQEYTPPPVSQNGHDDGHHHHEFGPHEGHVIELGDHEYHAELVFDADAKSVTVYLAGHELDEALAIAEESLALTLMVDGEAQTFALAAAPQEGDAEGSSSRFELAGDPTIAEHFDDVEELEGHVEVTIEGTAYEGAIAHDHGHAHEDEGDDDHGHAHEGHDQDEAHADDHDHEEGQDHDEDGHDHEEGGKEDSDEAGEG